MVRSAKIGALAIGGAAGSLPVRDHNEGRRLIATERVVRMAADYGRVESGAQHRATDEGETTDRRRIKPTRGRSDRRFLAG